MFSPTKVWRRWHRKINVNQKRFAVCSAVAASAVPALVMARGHRIQSIEEVPLVVENSFASIQKTRAAMSILQALHLGTELRRCKVKYYIFSFFWCFNYHARSPFIKYKYNWRPMNTIHNIMNKGLNDCYITHSFILIYIS